MGRDGRVLEVGFCYVPTAVIRREANKLQWISVRKLQHLYIIVVDLTDGF